MLGKGSVENSVRELDEVIRLIHFLGKCRPSGLTATLWWAEERLEAIRNSIHEVSAVSGS
jgi:hypothetical protein